MSDNTPPATPGDDANDVRPDSADAAEPAPANAPTPAEDKPKAPAQSSDDLLDMIRMQVSAARKRPAEPDPEPVPPKAKPAKPVEAPKVETPAPVVPVVESPKVEAPSEPTPAPVVLAPEVPAEAPKIEAPAPVVPKAETPKVEAPVEAPKVEVPKPAAPDPEAFFQKLRAAAKDVEVPATPAQTDDDPLQLGKLAVTETPEAPEAPAPDAAAPVEAPAEGKRGRELQPGQERTGTERRRRKRGGRDRKKRSGTAEDSSRQPEKCEKRENRESENISAPAPEISEADTALTGAYYEQVVERPKRPFIHVEPGEPLDLPRTDPRLAAKFEKTLAKMGQAVVVRYSEMRQTGLFEHSLEVPPVPGTTVVIRSERGVELGKVLVRVAEAKPKPPVETPDPVEPVETPEGESIPAGVDEMPVDTSAEVPMEAPADAPADDSADGQSGCGCVGGGCGDGEGGGCGSGGGCGGCGDDAKPYGWIERDQLVHFLATNGDGFPFNTAGRVLRVANTHDLSDDKAMRDRVPDQLKYCREQIRELKLRMRVVSVENLLGGERMVFCFTSEDRVDFRDLVKRLTAKFKTRVELRQVGARDEARIKADYERCGQRCCCQADIKDLKPVSMRMAKLQKATLDPSKISGRCSRLMCCLRYEDACYTELKKTLPHKNTWVRTESMIGRVLSTHVLSQMVKVRLIDGTPETFAIEEIIERNCDEPDPQEARSDRRPRRDAPRDRSQRSFLRDNESKPKPAVSEAPAQAEAATPSPDAPASPASQGETPAPKTDANGEPRKRRRRGGRRRRKPRGEGGGGGNAGGGAGAPSGGGSES